MIAATNSRRGPFTASALRGSRGGVLPLAVTATFLLLTSPGFAGAQTNTPANLAPASTDAAQAVRAEEIRTECLAGRRCVCGRVLKVFPDGVLVESGYPSLLRDSLHGAWHLPGTVSANRPPNLVESREPDSICVGTVFLTHLPKLRGAKIEPYDYVVLHSYPAGQFTYSSVGNIQHTVRRFSGGLETAVSLLQQAEPTEAAAARKP